METNRNSRFPLILGVGLLVVTLLLVVSLAGNPFAPPPNLQAAGAIGPAGPAHGFGVSQSATVTPTVTLTPPATDQYAVYLPFVEKQVVIPGSLSIKEVYTTDYEGNRQTTFRPCQAVALWIQVHNDADIAQPATFSWQTRDPQGQRHAHLEGRRQVAVPPGESTLRFLGAPDLDAPAGTYRLRAWFTSGTDRQEHEGAITLAGEPAPIRYLDGFTAEVVTDDWDRWLIRVVKRDAVFAAHPVALTDTFTPDDKYVVQSALWEGVRPDSIILTERYRPNGRRWGNARYTFVRYEDRPGCLRRQSLFWEIDRWMLETPGQWRLTMSSDDGATLQGELFFTLTE